MDRKNLVFVSTIIIVSFTLGFLFLKSTLVRKTEPLAIAVAGPDSLSLFPPNISVTTYPPKVRPGDVLLVTASISSQCSINSVNAEIFFEKGSDFIVLNFDSKINKWSGAWIVHHTKDQTAYPVIVIAKTSCGIGKGVGVFFDPTVSHSADQIEPGMFKDGDFFFEENLHIYKSAIIYENLIAADNTLFVDNTTKTVKSVNMDVTNNLESYTIEAQQITGQNTTTESLNVNTNAKINSIDASTVITTGKVGVGVTNPTEQFEVSGNTVIDGDTKVKNNLNVDGQLYVKTNVILEGTISLQGDTTVSGTIDFNNIATQNFIVQQSTTLSNDDCTDDIKGFIYFNTDQNTFMGCDGTEFRHLSYQPKTIIGDDTSGRKWSDNTYARSCYNYLHSSDNEYAYEGATGSGTYLIDPENTGTAFKVYCDMDTDGGGWTMVLKTCLQYNHGGTGWGSNLGDNEYSPDNVATFACPSTEGGKLSDTKIQSVWDASGQKDLMCKRGDYNDWVKNTNMNNGVWLWSTSGYNAGLGSDYNSYSGQTTSISNGQTNNHFGWWNSNSNSGCSCYYSSNWGCTTRTRGNNWGETQAAYFVR